MAKIRLKNTHIKSWLELFLILKACFKNFYLKFRKVWLVGKNVQEQNHRIKNTSIYCTSITVLLR